MFLKMVKLACSFLTLVFILENVECVSYNFGDCPKIKAFQNFNMSKFLGLWYIVQGDDNSILCASMDFRAVNSSSPFSVEQTVSYHFLPIQHITTRTGRLRIIDKSIPAGMKIRWHWSIPSQYMIVFDTDYSHYAGILLCSSLGITSESKIFILSRTTVLDGLYTKKIKETLKLNYFSTSEITEIDHNDCPTKKSEDTFKLDITPNILSAKSIVDDIEKKIGETFKKLD